MNQSMPLFVSEGAVVVQERRQHHFGNSINCGCDYFSLFSQMKSIHLLKVSSLLIKSKEVKNQKVSSQQTILVKSPY